MLFQKRFHEGLRDGSITLTFRTWKTPKVKVGGRYRFTPKDGLEVRSIDRIAVGAVGNADARRAGFSSTDELITTLKKNSSLKLTTRFVLYRIAFHHVGVTPAAVPSRRPSKSAVSATLDRLERMDRLSRREPWTRRVLGLIERHPRVAASRLAPKLGRETRAFKADVRKLKALGLTVSFEVGYELTPLGRACLEK